MSDSSISVILSYKWDRTKEPNPLPYIKDIPHEFREGLAVIGGGGGTDTWFYDLELEFPSEQDLNKFSSFMISQPSYKRVKASIRPFYWKDE